VKSNLRPGMCLVVEIVCELDDIEDPAVQAGLELSRVILNVHHINQESTHLLEHSVSPDLPAFM